MSTPNIPRIVPRNASGFCKRYQGEMNMSKGIKILIGVAATLAVGAAVFFALFGWIEER